MHQWGGDQPRGGHIPHLSRDSGHALLSAGGFIKNLTRTSGMQNTKKIRGEGILLELRERASERVSEATKNTVVAGEEGSCSLLEGGGACDVLLDQ